MSQEYILITGASSGIGEGFARRFAKEGKSIIITARRVERLLELQKELQNDQVKVEIIQADLNDPNGPFEIEKFCKERGLIVNGLINNAGLGWEYDFVKLDFDQLHRMMQVNMFAIANLMRLFLPSMLNRKRGFILNVASTAAFQPLAHFSVYAATKAFVLKLSEGVYEEVRKQGVLVSCLCPGPTHTEFQGKADMEARFFATAQMVNEVVDAGMKAIQKKKAVAWTSLFQRLFSLFSELTPRPWIRWGAARVLEQTGVRNPS
jgi:short-subunit dehydrogenase